MSKLKKIEPKSFKKYGKIIDYGTKENKKNVRNLWRIVHNAESENGWRIAYLILREKTISRLEKHLHSDETFEPIKGNAILFVSKYKNSDKIECFILDKPIILYKGIWHAVLKIDKECEIKITENDKVSCEYWDLGFRANSLKQIQDKAVAGQKVFRFWRQV